MAPPPQPAQPSAPLVPDPTIAVVEEGSGLDARGWPVTLLRLVAAPDTHPWDREWRREAVKRSGWKWGVFGLLALLGVAAQCACATLGPPAKVPVAECEPLRAVPGEVCQTLEATCTFPPMPQGGLIDLPLDLPPAAGVVQVRVQAANQQKVPQSLKRAVSVSWPDNGDVARPVPLGTALVVPAAKSTSVRLEISGDASKEWGELCSQQVCVAKLEITASFGVSNALTQIAEAAGEQLTVINGALTAQDGGALGPGRLDTVLGRLPTMDGRCDASSLILLGQGVREALAAADGARRQMFGVHPQPFSPAAVEARFAAVAAQLRPFGTKTFAEHGWPDTLRTDPLWSRYIALMESFERSVPKRDTDTAFYWVRLAISPSAGLWRARVAQSPPLASRVDADGRVAFVKALSAERGAVIPIPGATYQVSVPDGLRTPSSMLNAALDKLPRCYAAPVTALPVPNPLEARTTVAALLELPPAVTAAITQAPWHALLAVGSAEAVASVRTKATPWVDLLCPDSFHVDMPVAWKDPRGLDLGPLLQLLPQEVAVSDALGTADDWVAHELAPKVQRAADGAVTALLADVANSSSIKEFRDELAVVGAAIDYRSASTEAASGPDAPLAPVLKSHLAASIATGLRQQFCHRLTSRGLYADVSLDDFPTRFPREAVDVFDFAPAALSCRLDGGAPVGGEGRGAAIVLTASLVRTWQNAVWAKAIGAAGVCPSEVKARIQKRWFPGDPDKFSDMVAEQSDRLYHVPHFEVPQAHLNALQGECGAHPCCKDFLALRRQYPDQVTEGTCQDEPKPPRILPDDTVPFTAVGRSATRDVACHTDSAADVLFTLGPQAGRYLNIQSCSEFSAYAHRARAHRVATHEMRDRCGGEPGYELGIDLSDKASYAKPPHPSVDLWPALPNNHQRFWMTTTIQNQVH